MKAKALLASLLLSTSYLPNVNATELSTLADWMTGSFNSKAQSMSNKSYYNINLEMTRIWQDRTDATWLYVEQAVASSMEEPYRQRVYKLEQAKDGKFISTVYSFAEPKKVIGAWQNPEKLAGISPEQLILRKGCHINISLDDAKSAFAGSTEEKQCSSKLRGASYATSHVDIKHDVLTSWDQGFDNADEQVWGAQKGPYIFDKVKNYSAN